jgi:hypothetical protein
MEGAQTRTLIRGNHASREFLCRMFELRQEGVLVDVELLPDTGERGIKGTVARDVVWPSKLIQDGDVNLDFLDLGRKLAELGLCFIN